MGLFVGVRFLCCENFSFYLFKYTYGEAKKNIFPTCNWYFLVPVFFDLVKIRNNRSQNLPRVFDIFIWLVEKLKKISLEFWISENSEKLFWDRKMIIFSIKSSSPLFNIKHKPTWLLDESGLYADQQFWVQF